MERHNGLEQDPEGAFVYHDDAQATIEALQARVKELEAKVELQETAVRCAGHALDESRETHNRQAAKIREQQEQLTQLQELVRALPNIEGEIMVSESLVLAEDPDMCSDMSDKQEAEAYAALLRYRATLDATTPAVCPDCNGDGAVDSGGTDPNGNPLMRRCGCREKGGDGE